MFLQHLKCCKDTSSLYRNLLRVIAHRDAPAGLHGNLRQAQRVGDVYRAALYYLKTLCMDYPTGRQSVACLVDFTDETVVNLNIPNLSPVFVLVRLMYFDFINQFVEKRRCQLVNRLILLN